MNSARLADTSTRTSGVLLNSPITRIVPPTRAPARAAMVGANTRMKGSSDESETRSSRSASDSSFIATRPTPEIAMLGDAVSSDSMKAMSSRTVTRAVAWPSGTPDTVTSSARPRTS